MSLSRSLNEGRLQPDDDETEVDDEQFRKNIVEVLAWITRAAYTGGPHGTTMYFISPMTMLIAKGLVADAIEAGWIDADWRNWQPLPGGST